MQFRKFKVYSNDIIDLGSTSKGNQNKWLTDNCYLKADKMGYESIAEFVVSDFLNYTENIPFAKYSLCEIEYSSKIYQGCFSENFLSDGEQCISVWDIMKIYHGTGTMAEKELSRYSGKDKFDHIMDIVENITHLDFRKYTRKVLQLDALTLNEDRHLSNLCVIQNVNGEYRLCPVFDNGLSLLSDTDEFPFGIPIRQHISAVKARPFSTDFIKQINYSSGDLLTIDFKKYSSELEKKNTEFKQKAFGRATSVLLSRCRKLEGIVWKQK